MMEKDRDVELRQQIKKIDWSEYIDFGIVEIKVRNGKCGIIDIKRTYAEND